MTFLPFNARRSSRNADALNIGVFFFVVVYLFYYYRFQTLCHSQFQNEESKKMESFFIYIWLKMMAICLLLIFCLLFNGHFKISFFVFPFFHLLETEKQYNEIEPWMNWMTIHIDIIRCWTLKTIIFIVFFPFFCPRWILNKTYSFFLPFFHALVVTDFWSGRIEIIKNSIMCVEWSILFVRFENVNSTLAQCLNAIRNFYFLTSYS